MLPVNIRYRSNMEKYPHLNDAVAAVLRKRRDELGMSKRQLATLAMIERSYITGLERGQWNLTINVLFYLCDALELEPDEFIWQVMEEIKKRKKDYQE